MITSSFDLFGRCEFARLTEELARLPFICGDNDLEDFFHILDTCFLTFWPNNDNQFLYLNKKIIS